MSEAPPETGKPEASAFKRAAPWLGRWFVWCFVLLFVLDAFIAVEVIHMSWTVLFGWVGLLRRVLPLVSWNGDLVGMAMLCLVLITIGVHFILSWFTAQVAGARNVTSASFHWPWKWTWCGLAAFGLTFLIGSSVAGAVHQIGWLLGSRGPWGEVKNRSIYHDMRTLGMEYAIALEESDGGVGNIAAKLWREGANHPGRVRRDRQNYHLLVILNADGKAGGIIVFPRDTRQRERWGALHVTDDAHVQVPAEKIDDLLKQHHARLVAL